MTGLEVGRRRRQSVADCSEADRTNNATSARSEDMGMLLEVVRTWDNRRNGVLQTGAAERHLGSPEKKADGGVDFGTEGGNPNLMDGKARGEGN